VTCLSIGKEMNYEEFILQYENIIVTHMILSFRDKTNLENLIHPIVRSLSTLDSEKNSNLTETLFCYLQHNQDINLTSKALHIHYNTLKYRIKRISELTNIDFHDSDLLFKIQLTQKVLQILRHNSMPY
jgi:sugar diacid utilization regulator